MNHYNNDLNCSLPIFTRLWAMYDQVSLCQKKNGKLVKTTSLILYGSVDAFCVALPM